MFVELPIEEAYAPLYSVAASSYLLLGGLMLAFLAGLFLARKMIIPIQALREGAAQIGAGNLEQRISIKTGDELELLADQFNDMAGRLEESYADLEKKVEQRTARAERVAGAADRDLGSAPGHQARPAIWSRCFETHAGECDADLRSEIPRISSICEGEAFRRSQCITLRRAYAKSSCATASCSADRGSLTRPGRRQGRSFHVADMASDEAKTP